MKHKPVSQKGQAGFNVLWIGIAVIVIIFGIKYYNDHRNDVVISPPHIDVH